MREVVDLHDVDRAQRALVGGKGANLGELTRIDGVRVPAGFCITTDAYARIVAAAASLDERLDALSRLGADDRDAIRALSAAIRESITAVVVPDDLVAAIADALARLGAHAANDAYAVRSSATAEDMPTASFAGLHDSSLDVVGLDAIVESVRRCWASLFSERAVAYRLRNGVGHRAVRMAVVVQRMVSPDAAGVLFTADPLTGNRKVGVVEATFGLAESLVSGAVSPDRYQVRDDAVVMRTIARDRPALTDAQVVRLVALGRRIEAHFARPQDIEWCLADDAFHVVQSRPITTLFPVPASADGESRVYISVGHQQMMTDAVKPLGISVRQLTATAPMHEAGGRWYVDATRALTSPASRAGLLDMVGRDNPLIRDALQTILDRGDFVANASDAGAAGAPTASAQTASASTAIETDPAIVDDLIARSEASVAQLQRDIEGKTGPALLDFILADFQELRRVLFDPRSHQAIMASMEAYWWLDDHLRAWLGEKNAADVLTQSVPHNVTSEMGLALLDVADAIRPHAQVVAFLQRVEDDGFPDERFLDELLRLDGGREVRDAIRRWLDRYGMRGVGEIDITRPRWSERPSTLAPLILGNVRNFAPGAAPRRFEQGKAEALRRAHELLTRLRTLPDGERKVEETRRAIERLRTFAGYREYPKYGMVSRYFVYKQALLAEADRLVEAGVLRAREDIYWLTLHELRDVVLTRSVDERRLREREEAFRTYQALTPPRVLTSDGESVGGTYRRDDVPPGALVGLGVSAGTVEGRARVIVDMTDADLDAGDILVTTYTDPSWTPLFVAIAALVTEVGGLMTHGAVIAREYGLPAVVGVEHATRLIRDGQRVRVHGSDGFVELLA